VKNGGLVKTVRFSKPKYVGDPINTVRIFNEKEIDELMVLDIEATISNKEPDFKMIKYLAEECRMPLCYGGGVKNINQIEKIISLGVEKVAISSAAIESPRLVTEAANSVGSQSVVIVMDVKRSSTLFGKYELRTNNGSRKTGVCPLSFCKKLEILGAGEIIINSIDCDGVMKGYDIALIRAIKETVSVPVTAMGGAGSLKDMGEVIRQCGVSGVAAGSLFVFKGIYKAVLINYPDRKQKEEIIWTNLLISNEME
jgi:cyclase